MDFQRGNSSGWRSRGPWLLLAGLLVSRVLLVVFAGSLSGDDGNRYLSEAVNLWRHGTFSTEAGEHPAPTAHDVPLFPLLMTAFLVAGGSTMVAATMTCLANCVFFSAAAAGVYDLARLVSGSHFTAILAMAIFGLLPEAIPYSVFHMPDSMFLALLVWSLVAFVRFLRTGAPGPLRVSFLLWGLSVLVKPISLYFGVVLALLAVVRVRRVAVVVLGLMAGYSVLVPWLARNYVRFGVAGISSIGGTNLFHWNYRYMVEDMGVPDAGRVLAVQEARATAAIPPGRDNPMVRASVLGALAVREVLSHPGQYIASVLKRHPRLYAGTGSIATLRLLGDTRSAVSMEGALAGQLPWREVPARAIALQIGSWALALAAYLAAAVGTVRLCRRGDWLPLIVVLSTVVYFAVLIGPVTSTRYRIPMAPALAVLAACGVRAGGPNGTGGSAFPGRPNGLPHT
jgi:hypothetical protein